jgi:hypothetical protein
MVQRLGQRQGHRLIDVLRPNPFYDPMNNVIVWDIETVPDLKSFGAANGHDGKAGDEIRAAMGDKFPKHIYHSILSVSALS